jgi:nucleotide-binding universal stress UspA family protein
MPQAVGMRWILGVDARPRSEGAFRTAAWIAAHGHGRIVGVHVVPQAPRVSERDDLIDEVTARELAEAEAALSRCEAREALLDLEALPGTAIEATLAAAAEHHEAEGIVIGRSATTEGSAIVRLGRVARRLARMLPRALMIVPPDHRPEDRPGPVVLGTDMHDDAVAAARFALRLARDLGRDLEVVHVVPMPPFPYVPLPGTTGPELDDRLGAWTEAQGLGGATCVTFDGDPVGGIIAHADSVKAPFIVVGSRRMSTIERVFQSSTATDLGRFARCPVIVVPPPPTKRAH